MEQGEASAIPPGHRLEDYATLLSRVSSIRCMCGIPFTALSVEHAAKIVNGTKVPVSGAIQRYLQNVFRKICLTNAPGNAFISLFVAVVVFQCFRADRSALWGADDPFLAVGKII